MSAHRHSQARVPPRATRGAAVRPADAVGHEAPGTDLPGLAGLRDLVEGLEHVWPRRSQAPAPTELSRRGFMSLAAGIGGGLLLAVVGAGAPAGASAQTPPRAAPPLRLSAYVRIAPDGRITLYSKNPEIGQNIKTAFGLILAEELDARWADVVVEQSPIDPVYGSQFSGGSLSVPQAWMTLRQAGAGARAMLLAAAAQRWGVPVSGLTTSESTVHHASSGRSLGYGELATEAAALPVPQLELLKLKERKDWRLLGRRHRNVDGRAIVTGQPMYGIDVQLPDMRVAVCQRCPMVYGKVRSANLDEIRRLPGVEQAFIAEGTGRPTEMLAGVVIIAKNTWSALAARRKLAVVWDEAPASRDSWTRYSEQASVLMAKAVGEQTIQSGSGVDEALADQAGGRRVQARYTYGFVAHGQLEPMNCTAWYRRDASGNSLTLWAPTQTPTAGRAQVAGLLQLPLEKVTVHQQRIGGGFGRRLVNDYMVEAALISRQAGGIPVKLMWTREDDLEHDFMRPGGFMAFQGVLDGQGRLAAWNSHLVHFNSEGGAAVNAAHWQPNEFPALHLARYRASQTLLPLKMPTGSFRAPGANTAAWVVQSFLHEMSAAAGRDHVEFLLEVINSRPEVAVTPASPRPSLVPARATAVVRAAAERSGWGKRALAPGHGLGLAFHYSHGGHFAEVAEVSVANVDGSKRIQVHQVWVVGDIGPIVDLSSAENQCQGCIVDALSTMMLELTMEGGQIEQKNFDRYPVARIDITPPVDVHFLPTDYPPTGVGEPAFPPLAPAVCNAVFAATGQRIRTLPVSREGYSIGA